MKYADQKVSLASALGSLLDISAAADYTSYAEPLTQIVPVTGIARHFDAAGSSMRRSMEKLSCERLEENTSAA